MESVPFHSRLLSAEVKRRLQYYPRALDTARYVQAHLEEPIRLEDVARNAGLVPCAFSRYFAEKTGITYSALLKLLRIERAIEILEARDESLTVLAGQIGFSSYCAFARAFKDVTGTTPSEYRRRVLCTLRLDAA